MYHVNLQLQFALITICLWKCFLVIVYEWVQYSVRSVQCSNIGLYSDKKNSISYARVIYSMLMTLVPFDRQLLCLLICDAKTNCVLSSVHCFKKSNTVYCTLQHILILDSNLALFEIFRCSCTNAASWCRSRPWRLWWYQGNHDEI